MKFLETLKGLIGEWLTVNDLFVVSQTFDGEYYSVHLQLKIDDDYLASAQSRSPNRALGYALRDLATQLDRR